MRLVDAVLGGWRGWLLPRGCGKVLGPWRQQPAALPRKQGKCKQAALTFLPHADKITFYLGTVGKHLASINFQIVFLLPK